MLVCLLYALIVGGFLRLRGGCVLLLICGAVVDFGLFFGFVFGFVGFVVVLCLFGLLFGDFVVCV